MPLSIPAPGTGPASGLRRMNLSPITSYWAATPISARRVTTVGACECTMQIAVDGSTSLLRSTRLASSSGCRVASQTTSSLSLRRTSKRPWRRLPRRSKDGETIMVVSAITCGPCEMTGGALRRLTEPAGRSCFVPTRQDHRLGTRVFGLPDEKVGLQNSRMPV